MKNLIYKHANENGDTTTIHKSGQSWISCLGQIDEQLVRYCGEGATMATVLVEDLYEIVNTLDTGEAHQHRYMAEPEGYFDLTPTDQVAKDSEQGDIRPLLTVIHELLDWNCCMGDFDAPCWHKAQEMFRAQMDREDAREPKSDNLGPGAEEIGGAQ